MSKLDSNEKLFSRLMQKGKLEMPFHNFEETMMARIKLNTRKEKLIKKEKRISIFFFVLGTLFGLFSYEFITKFLHNLLNIPLATALLSFQIVFVIFLLVQLNIILNGARSKRESL